MSEKGQTVTQNQQIVATGANSPYQYMDMFMTKFIFEQMGTITSSGLTPSSIMKMLGVLSLDEVRKMFM